MFFFYVSGARIGSHLLRCDSEEARNIRYGFVERKYTKRRAMPGYSHLKPIYDRIEKVFGVDVNKFVHIYDRNHWYSIWYPFYNFSGRKKSSIEIMQIVIQAHQDWHQIMNKHLINPLSFECENKPKLLRLKLFVIVYFIEPKTKTSM